MKACKGGQTANEACKGSNESMQKGQNAKEVRKGERRVLTV